MNECCWRISLGGSDPLCDTCCLHRNLQVVCASTLCYINSSETWSVAQMRRDEKTQRLKLKEESASSSCQINQASVCRVNSVRKLLHISPLHLIYMCVCVFVCVCMQALYKSDHEQSECASHQTRTFSVVLAEWIISDDAEHNNATDANRPNLRNDCCLISGIFFLICRSFRGGSVLCTFLFQLFRKPLFVLFFRSEVSFRSSSWINNKGAISAQLADFSLHLHRKTSCFVSHTKSSGSVLFFFYLDVAFLRQK